MKQVYAWLRMIDIGGVYPLPSSEAEYRAHATLIDSVIPANGLILQADGTWVRDEARTGSAFAVALPGLARAAHQRYLGILDGAALDILCPILEAPSSWPGIAESAMNLLGSGFDAPWDGVVYDVRQVPPEYTAAHGQFILALIGAAHDAGLSFVLCSRAIVEGWADWFPSWDILAAADEYIGYSYALYSPLAGCSIGPYWWAEDSIQQGLEHGLDRRRFVLGLPNYSIYYPIAGNGTRYEISYSQALGLADSLRWVEADHYGPVREKRGTVGDGFVWVSDGDTIRSRLRLVDDYRLVGAMLFCPGMGDESVWTAIAKWRRPATRVIARAKYRDLYRDGGLFGSLARTGAPVRAGGSYARSARL